MVNKDLLLLYILILIIFITIVDILTETYPLITINDCRCDYSYLHNIRD